MDVKDYCAGLQSELTGWKAKVYDVVRKIDKMPSGDKEKMFPHVNELHMIIEEFTDRIDRLNTECPTQWEPDKIEIEGKVAQFETKWEDVWKNVSPADVGG
jgi:predicted nuclease with TOPRIM domain